MEDRVQVRCSHCGGATRVPLGVFDGDVTCGSCGRRPTVGEGANLGATPLERSRRAFQYAISNKVDLVSAYLVLHGILPREAATPLDGGTKHKLRKALDASKTPAESAGPSEVTASSEAQVTAFDPGYCEAIEHGYLTFQQAVERGDRIAFATEISERYNLPMDLAFMVTDSVIQLDEARRRNAVAARSSYAPQPTAAAAASRPSPLAAVLLLGLVVLCGWGLLSWRSGGADTRRTAGSGSGQPGSSAARDGSSDAYSPPASSQTPSSGKVEILLDESGAMTQVSGPNPTDVLETFCSHPWNQSRYAFRSIAPGVVPSAGERIGLVLDRDRNATMSILISRDARTRRWRMGSGQGPITFFDGTPPPNSNGS